MRYGKFEKIIDILYPRRCFVCHRLSLSDRDAFYVCEKCQDKPVKVKEPTCIRCGKPISDKNRAYCGDCERVPRNFDQGCALYVYDEVMKSSILYFKEKGRAEYAKAYAGALYRTYKEKYLSWKLEALVPVPLSVKKERQRGFNQAFLLAKELGRLMKLPVRTDWIIKKEGAEQKGLSAFEREKNSKKSFILSENIVQSRSVLVVDDVYTTGSTVHSISGLLKTAGCKKVYFTTVCIGSEADDR